MRKFANHSKMGINRYSQKKWIR